MQRVTFANFEAYYLGRHPERHAQAFALTKAQRLIRKDQGYSH
jgi:hypothetical protein